jgi:eukaryotic-like serine/threonine-protein kinase
MKQDPAAEGEQQIAERLDFVIDHDEFQGELPEELVLGAQIHDGGQRQVFEANDNGTKIVIKLMPEASRQRAEREVSIGSTFDHSNLAKILDDEVHEVEIAGKSYVWFREEFIDGETLDKRTGRYDSCEALALVRDLIAAVSYLWECHDVVHRDIKPLNIIRRPDGSFVLIDVGIGRHQGDTSITSGPLGPGTEGHLAPEQILPNKGSTLDARTDLFLIGIVLYEVLTGQLPFRSSDPDYWTKLGACEWVRPEGMSETLADLLEKLLGRHPHQRPHLAQAAALVEAAREESKCS